MFHINFDGIEREDISKEERKLALFFEFKDVITDPALNCTNSSVHQIFIFLYFTWK